MARGYAGAFGRRVNAWYIWIPLCVMFIAPFLPWRRKRLPGGGRERRAWSLLHLDLVALLGLSVSLAFFNHADDRALDAGDVPVDAVPAGPDGAARLRARPAARRRCGVYLPISWLAIGVIFLVGFRVGLNVDELERDRRRLRRRDRGRQAPPRPAAVRELAQGQRQRRHLRTGRLLRLRPVPGDLRVERDLGRPAGGPRRGDPVRPADAVRPVLARPPGPGTDVGGRARLRVGRVPVHAVDAQLEHERLAGVAAAGAGAARDHLRAGAGGGRRARRPDQVRAAGARAAAPARSRRAAAPARGRAATCSRTG